MKMKKNWLIIAGIILVVAGAALSYFAKFPQAETLGFAGSMFGAGLAAAGFWGKREKTNALSIITIICLGAGAFMLGFGGFAESTMTTIITGVIGFVVIIAGIIVGFLPEKKKE